MRARRLARAIAFLLLIPAAACGGREPRDTASSSSDAAAPRATATASVSRTDARPRVVVLGDSLTAGLGLDARQAYPSLLQERVDAEGLGYTVVNAGVSGDTSAGGVSRLDWSLDGDVRVLIVALGGNDGLRGLPVEELRHNLSTIIRSAQRRNIRVILAGMEAPPNLGPAYVSSFRQVYRDLAHEHGVPFVPFLLEGVAGDPSLNQRDGIHPTADGARIVADTVWRVLRPALTRS